MNSTPNCRTLKMSYSTTQGILQRTIEVTKCDFNGREGKTPHQRAHSVEEIAEFCYTTQ